MIADKRLIRNTTNKAWNRQNSSISFTALNVAGRSNRDEWCWCWATTPLALAKYDFFHDQAARRFLLWYFFQFTGREPQPNLPPTCDQCPPGVPCNPATGACGRGKITLVDLITSLSALFIYKKMCCCMKFSPSPIVPLSFIFLL